MSNNALEVRAAALAALIACSALVASGSIAVEARDWSTVDDPTFRKLVLGELALGLFALAASVFVSSPYGKLSHASKIPGVALSPRLGWWLMELPATLSFGYTWFFLLKNEKKILFGPLFASLFALHYSNRGWFFPLSIRSKSEASFSVWVMTTGLGFTAVHGYLNAMWFGKHATHLNDPDWVKDPRFVLGFFLYLSSFAALVHSEWIMRNLRSTNDPNEPRYKIPKGGAYEWVSSPCYLFELTCWLGWFLMTWNPAGLGVFVVSFGNLFPRAFSTHAWYLDKFGDEYVALQRKAIIPGVL